MIPKRIRTKILVVFWISSTISVAGFLTLYYQLRQQEQQTLMVLETLHPISEGWLNLQSAIHHVIEVQNRWLLFNEDSFLQQQQEIWDNQIQPLLENIKKLYESQDQGSGFLEETGSMEEIREFFDVRADLKTLQNYQSQITQLVMTQQHRPREALFFADIDPALELMLSNLRVILKSTWAKGKMPPEDWRKFADFQDQLWQMRHLLQEYVLRGDPEMLANFRKMWIEYERFYLSVSSTIFNEQEYPYWRQLLDVAPRVKDQLNQLNKLLNPKDKNIALYKLEQEIIPLTQKTLQLINNNIQKHLDLHQKYKNNISNQSGNLQLLTLWITLFVSVSGYFIFGPLLSNVISTSLRELRANVRNIRDSDFTGNILIMPNDEVGELAHEFQDLLDAINERTLDANRSRQILQNSPFPMMLVNQDRKLVYLNPAAEHQLRALSSDLPIPPDQMIGKNIDFLLGQSSIDYHQFQNTLPMTPKIDIKIGTQVIEVTFSPLMDAEQHYHGAAVLHWRNVTGERHLMKELEEQSSKRQVAVEKLEKQNKRLEGQLALDKAQATIAQAINSLDVESILQAALDTLAQTTNSQLGVIYLLESGNSNTQLILKHYYTVDESVMDSDIYQEKGLPEQIFRTQKPIKVTDPVSDGKAFHLGIMTSKPKEILGYPLMFQKECLGVLLLASVSEFREELVPFIENSASHLAVAIQNALTFQTVQTQQHILETANMELEAATRTKSEFLANMSHELRTPLNAINNFTETLLDDDEENPITSFQRDRLTRIHSSGKNLLNLINSLLDLSKIEAGRMDVAPSNFNLRELIQSVLMLLESLIASKSMDLQFTSQTDQIECYSDPDKLRQILINLLGNAIKFTEKGGRIVVILERQENRFSISVEDSGCGIPADQLSSIFEAFRQVDGSSTRHHEGTGLGLALVKSMIQLLGGDIKVKSILNEGSVFTLIFPAKFEKR
ncbi:MAG: GAF domain-containing protein [SAR324 cluster bacterium]|nr:GAF domain-containing protein [SAR324 cluster bacterium]